MRAWTALLLATLVIPSGARAQFRDEFDVVRTDPSGRSGWRFRTGEGAAAMELRRGGAGYASILVDATADERNVWWALIQREVSAGMDLAPLREPETEVRIAARIRVSHAPRRVNLQVQTQRTTDYHSHLMEFDIPGAGEWHTISMTTRGFDAGPGDTLIAHMALMDWGRSKYRVDLDWIAVDLVDLATAGPDQGAAVPYRPPLADPASFAHALAVAHDATIDLEHPEVDLDDWSIREGAREVPLLAVDGARIAILRWNLDPFAGKRVAGSGLLELTTRSVRRKAESLPDFGLLRVVEILGGDPRWDQAAVTAASFRRGRPLDEVLNPQMIVDAPAAEGDGARTLLTIPKPVLQRLIDGITRGIALTPLGSLAADFYAMEHDGGRRSARLLFDLEPE
ncbi:MAG TPA: hypothetical protein VMS56_01560 [Thermoanaerobaculia bacterium]|nr:hypothetical protein [Thermoanaerobaculia bacterium]